MKKVIIMIMVLVNVYGYTIDGHTLPYKNNPTLAFRANCVNVGFNYTKRIYNSDRPMIAYIYNGQTISYNNVNAGYNYFKHRAVLQTMINVNNQLGYHEFVLIINGQVVDRFSIGIQSNSCHSIYYR